MKAQTVADRDREIVIVSGLPRSGTSLMMQMLDHGGIEAVSDGIRSPDVDNPRGYYEFEIVKKIKEDASWLPETRGKVFKMVSQLLYDLPKDETYRVVFMRRDFDEMLASQEKMLARLGRPIAPREEIKRAFRAHLEKLNAWLPTQENMRVLVVHHHDLVSNTQAEVARVNAFFGGRLDEARMIAAVDPSLYRNRKPEAEPAG
ncbi:sulfotransferase domain-containing protein [Paludisphaera sp.]|uniref:sulfotransferase family protein n=1 Tax=Paludisphaera sp. TaxID=2017432 RepID=UPI00301CA389